MSVSFSFINCFTKQNSFKIASKLNKMISKNGVLLSNFLQKLKENLLKKLGVFIFSLLQSTYNLNFPFLLHITQELYNLLINKYYKKIFFNYY